MLAVRRRVLFACGTVVVVAATVAAVLVDIGSAGAAGGRDMSPGTDSISPPGAK